MFSMEYEEERRRRELIRREAELESRLKRSQLRGDGYDCEKTERLLCNTRNDLSYFD